MVIERVFFKTDLINDNYFYAGYILGYYQQNNCPRYLQRENFSKLKINLEKGKLKLVHGTLLSAIDDSTIPFTVASFLDHMDWMTERQINEEITHLLQKMDPIRGKIFWRSFADDVHAAPLMWLSPEKVDDSDDRVGMYWSTWIAHIKDLQVGYAERIDTKQDRGLITNLWTGKLLDSLFDFLSYFVSLFTSSVSLLACLLSFSLGFKMVSFPFWKPLVASTLKASGHAKDMEAFYKYQKEGYDAFREGLLHARPVMMEAFPLKKDGKMVWVDIGGGTARNLEFFPIDVIKKYFKTIYIVDISASLLEMAQKRLVSLFVDVFSIYSFANFVLLSLIIPVLFMLASFFLFLDRIDDMGIGSICKVVEYDVTKESLLNVLSGKGSVDMVTMSYSFSMIPDQKATMTNIFNLLKPNGHIAIADFYLSGNYDDCLSPLFRRLRAAECLFHKTWFSFDHVYLLEDSQLEFRQDQWETVWDNRFRGAVPFLPFLKPYHGIHIMRKKE
jgi:ubiquinone/menaquinone biosynthesis C-methylase UbiE